MDVYPFIRKLFDCCKNDGYVCITVPSEISGFVTEGHVSFWNAGSLMINVIHSGYSCVHAGVKTYGLNVSLFVPKEPILDFGDYRTIFDSRKYLPPNFDYGNNGFGGVHFNGNIAELNWY